MHLKLIYSTYNLTISTIGRQTTHKFYLDIQQYIQKIENFKTVKLLNIKLDIFVAVVIPCYSPRIKIYFLDNSALTF